MKILFSPSETKNSGGVKKRFDKDSFIFPELFEKRMEIVNQYNDFIKNASKDELSKIFGTKKEEVLSQYSKDIFETPTMKVIQRYEGVAFDYLKYKSLCSFQLLLLFQNELVLLPILDLQCLISYTFLEFN